jgi:hypothetical protein
VDFRKRYIGYLNELAQLSRKHDELTDTDVRERLHEVINWCFIWGKPLKIFPGDFEMMSAPGNKAVAAATKSFIEDALAIVKADRVKPGAARHALIEDPRAKTSKGDSYDLFLGSSDEVLPAEKPAPDSDDVPEKSAKQPKHKQKYDLAELTVKAGGKTIVPTFDAKDDMYEYRWPSGSVSRFAGFYYSAEQIRAAALESLSEDEDDDNDDAPSVGARRNAMVAAFKVATKSAKKPAKKPAKKKSAAKKK